MANDKFRKMKLRSKARPPAADAPRPTVKKANKRTGNGRSQGTA